MDFVCLLEKETTTADLIAAFKAAEAGSLKGILGVSEDSPVSMDFKGDARSSIVDAEFCQVLGGNLAKVLAWYDNEWAYSMRVADLCNMLMQKGL